MAARVKDKAPTFLKDTDTICKNVHFDAHVKWFVLKGWKYAKVRRVISLLSNYIHNESLDACTDMLAAFKGRLVTWFFDIVFYFIWWSLQMQPFIILLSAIS